jgi:hypothetical protein
VALDATVFGSNTDSYVTLTEAGSIAAAAGLTSWAGKSEAERESALRRAADDIDVHRFHEQTRAVSTQARVFPRLKDDAAIPVIVKKAQVFQAEWIAVGGLYESDRKNWEGARAAPMKDAGVGSPLCPRALAMLAPLISRSGEYAPI